MMNTRMKFKLTVNIIFTDNLVKLSLFCITIALLCVSHSATGLVLSHERGCHSRFFFFVLMSFFYPLIHNDEALKAPKSSLRYGYPLPGHIFGGHLSVAICRKKQNLLFMLSGLG